MSAPPEEADALRAEFVACVRALASWTEWWSEVVDVLPAGLDDAPDRVSRAALRGPLAAAALRGAPRGE